MTGCLESLKKILFPDAQFWYFKMKKNIGIKKIRCFIPFYLIIFSFDIFRFQFILFKILKIKLN